MAPKTSPLFSDTYYTITARQSKKALQADGDGMVRLAPASREEAQQWRFEPVGEYFKIFSRRSGQLLDIMLAGSENGAQVHQWEDLGAEHQLWLVKRKRGGYYTILAKNSGRCLDVVGLDQPDGAPIQIWDDLGGENQQWKITPVPVPTAGRPTTQAKAGVSTAKAATPGKAASAKKAKDGEVPTTSKAQKKLAAPKATKKLPAPKAQKKLAGPAQPEKLAEPKPVKKLAEKSQQK